MLLTMNNKKKGLRAVDESQVRLKELILAFESVTRISQKPIAQGLSSTRVDEHLTLIRGSALMRQTRVRILHGTPWGSTGHDKIHDYTPQLECSSNGCTWPLRDVKHTFTFTFFFTPYR